MSRPIDEKIASLRLDNKDFDDNARNSLLMFSKLNSTLDKGLKVDTKEASKGLKELQDSAKNIDLGLLERALETVSFRFSNLGIMATNVLNRITDRVIDLGTNMTKFLTIDGIKEGYEEYETKINSIQTIMANTGGKHTLQEVKDVLEELNQYADDTIYSFPEMVRNIGYFTTAGVDLYDSVKAIKGISNLAATVGADAGTTARVMYQISQAFGAEAMKLVDWRSLEQGGFGGMILKEAAEKFGIEMGRIGEGGLTEAFRETLKDGWFDIDVMTATFGSFADNAEMLFNATSVRTAKKLVETVRESLGSGWARAWEGVIGDFNEATLRYTSLKDVIENIFNENADARMTFVEELQNLGVGDELFRMFEDGVILINSWIEKGSELLWKIFPKPTAVQVVKTLMQISSLMRSLTVRDYIKYPILEHLADILSGIRTSMLIIKEVGWQAISGIFSAITGRDVEQVLGFLAGLKQYPEALLDILKQSEPVKKFFKETTRIAKDVVVDVAGAVYSGYTMLSDFLKKIGVPEYAGKLWDFVVQNIKQVVDFVLSIDIQDVFSRVSNAIVVAYQTIYDIITKLQIDKLIEDTFNLIRSIVAPFVEYLESIKIGELIDSVTSTLSDGIGSFISYISGIDYQGGLQKVKGLFGPIIDYFRDIDLSKYAPKLWNGIRDTVGKIVEFFTNLDYRELFTKFKDSIVTVYTEIDRVLREYKIYDLFKATWNGVSSVATSVYNKFKELSKDASLRNFWQSIKNIAILIGNELSPLLSEIRDQTIEYMDNLKQKLQPVVYATNQVKAVVEYLWKFVSKKLLPDAAIFGGLFLIWKILQPIVNAFKSLTSVTQLIVGSLSKLANSMAKALNAFSFNLRMKGFKQFALAILILVGAIVLLTFVDWTKALTAVGILALVLIELGVMLAVISKFDMTGETSMTIIAFAGSIAVLALALKLLSTIKFEEAKDGLKLITVMLLGMAAAMRIMTFKGPADASVGILTMIGFAASVYVLALAVLKVGQIDEGVLLTGGLTIVGLVTAMSLAMRIIGKYKPNPGALLAIVGFGIAIDKLSDVAIKIGSVKWYVALQGVVAIIGLTVALMGMVTALGVSNVNFGQALGNAILMVSVASAVGRIAGTVEKFGTMNIWELLQGAAAIIAIILSLSKATSSITLDKKGIAMMGLLALGIGLLVPQVEMLGKLKFGEAAQGTGVIVALIVSIAAATRLITPTMVPSLLAFAGGLVAFGVMIAGVGWGFDKLSESLVKLSSIAADSIPKIISNLLDLLDGVLQAIPKLVGIILAFFAELIASFATYAPEMFRQLLELILGMMRVVDEKLPEFIKLGSSILNNLFIGLEKELPDLIENAVRLIITFIQSLADSILNNRHEIVDATWQLIKALLSLIVTALDTILEMILGFDPDLAGKLGLVGEHGTEALKKNLKIKQAAEREMADALSEIDKAKAASTSKAQMLAFLTSRGYNQDLSLASATEDELRTMINAYTKKQQDAYNAASKVAQNANRGVQQHNSYTHGMNFTIGFANGIRAYQSSVEAAAATVARAGSRTVSQYYVERSPSRRMMKSGANFTLGFANGIGSKVKEVVHSAKDVAKTAYQTMVDNVGDLSDIVDDVLTLRPEIRPVLNMDDVVDTWDPTRPRFDALGRTINGLNPQSNVQTPTVVQNDYHYTVNNEKLLDGATIIVREEADIERIAEELDRISTANIIKKGYKVLPV